jgi:hypothetical protein
MAKKSKAEAPAPVHIAEETVPAKLNKSQEIRKALEAIQASSGENPKANDVVEALEKRGVTVKPADVYQVFNRLGIKSGRVKKTKKKIAASKPDPKLNRKKPTKNTSGSFTVEELKAANRFVKTIGDAARAVELMDAMFGG